MIEQLRKSLGNVTASAEKIGIARCMHYEWIEKDEEYAKAVKEIDEVVLDFAENKLHQLVQQGDRAATFFLLKYKGRKRGYVKSHQVEATVEHKGLIWDLKNLYKPKKTNPTSSQ